MTNQEKAVLKRFNSLPHTRKTYYQYWEVNFRHEIVKEWKKFNEIHGEENAKNYEYYSKYVYMFNEGRYRETNVVSPN